MYVYSEKYIVGIVLPRMSRVVVKFSQKCNISALFLSANVVNLP